MGAVAVKNKNRVQLLAKTFSQELIERGYSKEELVQVATIILESAIVVTQEEKDPEPARYLQVVS